mmetsp:Transcript_79724/g.257889  ORF Transcript_79724/g.257889 Transcript_79724/m.257889 type:complete len:552 (-) Transcript_79724:94-1749(-)
MASVAAVSAALGAQVVALGPPAVAAALGAQVAALGVVLLAPCLCKRSPPAPSTEPESKPTPIPALLGECSCRLERCWCHKSCHVSLVGDMLVLGRTRNELEKVTMLPGTQSSADGKALTVSVGKQQLLKLWFDKPHTASMWATALGKASTCSGKIAEVTFPQLEEAREAVGAKSPTTMVQRPSIEEVKSGSDIKFINKERPLVDDEKPPLAGVVGRGGLKLSLGEAFPNMRDLIAQEVVSRDNVTQFARQERRAPPQSPRSSVPTTPPSAPTAPSQLPCTSVPIVATVPEVPISAALAFAGALASQLAASVPPPTATVAQDVPAAVLPGGDFRARISCDEGLALEALQMRPDVTWSSLRSRLVQDKADARRAAAATGAPRRPVSLAAVGAPAPLPRPKAWAPALAATGRSAAAAAEAVLPTLPQFDLKPMPSLPPRPEPAIGRIEASRPKAAPKTQAKASSGAAQPKARQGTKMAATASLTGLQPSTKTGAPPPRTSALGAPAARGSSYGSTPTSPRSAAGSALGAKAKPPTPRTGLGTSGAPGPSRVRSP